MTQTAISLSARGDETHHFYNSFIYLLIFHVALCTQKPHTAYWGVGGGVGGGRRGAYLWIVRPFVAPTRKDQSQNHVREVGTPPVRSTLRTPQHALSTVVKNSHKVRMETEAKDCPTHYESPAPPPSFNSCEEQSQSPNGNWSKRLSNSLRESSPTSLFQQLWRTVTKSEWKLKQKTVQLTTRVQPHMLFQQLWRTVTKSEWKLKQKTVQLTTRVQPHLLFQQLWRTVTKSEWKLKQKTVQLTTRVQPHLLFQQLWRTVTKSEWKLKQKTVQLTTRVQPHMLFQQLWRTVTKSEWKLKQKTVQLTTRVQPHLPLQVAPELCTPPFLHPVQNHFLSVNSCSSKSHSSGAVWESRWTSWAVRPNEPSGFRGRKDLLHRASALVTTCP